MRPQHRTEPDRRLPGSDDIAGALLGARDGVSFDELVERIDGAGVRDLAAWLGHAVDEGIVEPVEGDLGPRRFRLRGRGKRVLAARRRAGDEG